MRRKPKLVFSEILAFAVDTFFSNKVRFALTSLGMVLGTASLILVVTIGLTGKQYLLSQIQAIGSNMIQAYYEGASIYGKGVVNDFLTIDDIRAVQQQLPGLQASSPMVQLHDSVTMSGGKQREINILGVSPEYRIVRNLEVLGGRFFDQDDSVARNKVALMTQKLAVKLYGSVDAAMGREMKLKELPFTIVGVFRERVDTFDTSEISEDTVLIPYTVSRYFTGTDTVKNVFFSMSDPADVPAATETIRHILHSRHRPGSIYTVQNLTELLRVGGEIADALTVVLLLISTLVLLVSGIGIMNIMLATVAARVQEIGVRKAVGATRQEIKYQFLAEAILIALGGGTLGILVGIGLPYSVRFFTSFRIPISGLSVVIALLVSSAVGILFGTVPASRAAQLDPVESLRQE